MKFRQRVYLWACDRYPDTFTTHDLAYSFDLGPGEAASLAYALCKFGRIAKLVDGHKAVPNVYQAVLHVPEPQGKPPRKFMHMDCAKSTIECLPLVRIRTRHESAE